MKKKSKKRSASNNVAPPDSPTLFIDRCAWSQRLGDALTALGITFIAHHEKFQPNGSDEEWLEVAGKERWVVLTRDKHIRRRANELDAYRRHGVVSFVLASGNASAADTAALVCRLYPKLIRKACSAKPPAMFSITLGGTISPIKL